MRLTKEDKEVLIYSVLMLVTLVLFALTFQINQRGSSIMESPRLLPYIVTGCMFLLSISGIIQSLRNNGRPTFAKIKGSFLAAAADGAARQTMLAIVIVAVYILLGIPYLGFYASSALLVLGITLGYVRRIKPYWAVVIAVAVTAGLYLIFAVAFGMRLR